MSNATFGLLIAAVLAASPALAQPAPDPATPAVSTPVAPPTTPAPTAKPAASGPTVSGIVVEGLPKKSCSSRDKDCIAVVVAELQEHYPEQLKAFCANWQMQAVRSKWVNDQLLASLGSSHQPTPPSFGVNSAVTKACSTDKPAEK
jgi:hypothetical protein